jgi:hypothetical protein
LHIKRVGDKLRISWSGPSDNFELQCKESLFGTSDWTPVSARPVIEGNDYTVSGDDFQGSKFYQLKRRGVPSLVFNPGETNKTIIIKIKGDLLNEPVKSFFVILSGALQADIRKERARPFWITIQPKSASRRNHGKHVNDRRDTDVGCQL